MPSTRVTPANVAVIGGGIAGSTIALYLSEIGLDVTLFEKGVSLVNGPPVCHLHAGGNLYREISDEQCVTLLKESIDLIRFYPEAIDHRPTVIAVPTDDSGTPQDLYPRLQRLQYEYEALIKADKQNKVLGESRDYFKSFDREQVEALGRLDPVQRAQQLDEWMIPVARHMDLEKVKFPIIMVQEYGLNLFRLASTVSLRLEDIKSCHVLLGHKVTDIAKREEDATWDVSYRYQQKTQHQRFDYLINAAGFQSGSIDDMLGFKRERLVEFKAAYVSQWEDDHSSWPEVVFYGERGTPRGMAQFTPYPGGYFQLHGMTKQITLFEDGLVKSSERSAQPKLKTKFIRKIEKAWDPMVVKARSRSAIDHLSQFIPSFEHAKVASRPLFGAQQIPGEDATLRAADVSFVDGHYARCEIVKASSVLSMADAITRQLIALGYVDEKMYGKRDFPSSIKSHEEQIGKYAELLGQERGYPVALTQRSSVK